MTLPLCWTWGIIFPRKCFLTHFLQLQNLHFFSAGSWCALSFLWSLPSISRKPSVLGEVAVVKEKKEKQQQKFFVYRKYLWINWFNIVTSWSQLLLVHDDRKFHFYLFESKFICFHLSEMCCTPVHPTSFTGFDFCSCPLIFYIVCVIKIDLYLMECSLGPF